MVTMEEVGVLVMHRGTWGQGEFHGDGVCACWQRVLEYLPPDMDNAIDAQEEREPKNPVVGWTVQNVKVLEHVVSLDLGRPHV